MISYTGKLLITFPGLLLETFEHAHRICHITCFHFMSITSSLLGTWNESVFARLSLFLAFVVTVIQCPTCECVVLIFISNSHVVASFPQSTVLLRKYVFLFKYVF